jgi:hypothetical protein
VFLLSGVQLSESVGPVAGVENLSHNSAGKTAGGDREGGRGIDADVDTSTNLNIGPCLLLGVVANVCLPFG